MNSRNIIIVFIIIVSLQLHDTTVCISCETTSGGPCFSVSLEKIKERALDSSVLTCKASGCFVMWSIDKSQLHIKRGCTDGEVNCTKLKRAKNNIKQCKICAEDYCNTAVALTVKHLLNLYPISLITLLICHTYIFAKLN